MIIKAVIDRFEGKMAVMLIEKKKIVVLMDKLPKMVKEGDWLKLEFKGSKLVHIEYDEEESAKRKERIADKLAQLRGN